MKILMISIPDSIHTTRWIAQILDQGWEVHLFPSIDKGNVHPEMRGITVHHSFYGTQASSAGDMRYRGFPVVSHPAAALARKILEHKKPLYRILQLRDLVERINPDIVHSMEFQHGGYLTLEARQRARKKFPPWIATNWGSDIYLFGQLAAHEMQIRSLLQHCDFYSCECRRDALLAAQFGFKGTILPVFPNTGGFDLEKIKPFRQTLVSKRKIIMLKGYQHWAGRALVGIRALARCADALKGYEVRIYSPSCYDVAIEAELLSKTAKIPVKLVEPDSPHMEILKLHGQARISIGLSISDAISTSFLEAFVMGSFPIQSWTSCADEWVENGKTGLLVSPNDPDDVEKAIRKALADDNLVDAAAAANFKVAEAKLDYSNIKSQAVAMYKTAAQTRRKD